VKILALDTATENCSAALLIDGAIVSRERPLGQGHAGQILPMINEVLAEAGIALRTLDAIAFGRGPGGFTGVRLAASVTQGLAFGAGVPVVPVSNLRALAQRLFVPYGAIERVLVCTDARMREVYWGCFRRCGGLAAPVGDEQLSSPEGVRLPDGWACNAHGHASAPAASLPQPAPAPGVGEANRAAAGLFGAGRGFAAYPELTAAMRPLLQGIRDDLLPRASEIAALAAPEVAAGRIFTAEQALPIYLRNDVVRPAGGSH
jgi:tRNA threonylcarbamoyladenosine biosynthesis protein TsaB